MSAVQTPPQADRPTVPAGRFSGLLRAELHRFTARRFIRLLLLTAALVWVGALVIGLLNWSSPTPERLAAAEQQRQEQVELSAQGRAECLEQVPADAGMTPDEWCGPPIQDSDFPIDMFISPPPFSFAEQGPTGAAVLGLLAGALAFLVGATFVGAEWSSRSMTNLLFWEPRRSRVLGAKAAVVAAASVVLGVVAQVAWLAMAGIWQGVVGDGRALPDGFWSEFVGAEGRGVLLTVFAGLIGFGLTNLVRNTGAALGTAFIYVLVVETAVRALRPEWQPWLLTNNVTALALPDGLTVVVEQGERVDAQGNVFWETTEYLITHLQSGIVLTVVTAVVVGVGVVLFSRRDVP
ncbi:ABC transporter permease subunit [Modestobacter roseus]|uniref:ABC-type transport system involved in multi-copper enzyme maturation permease subunit n=1 Tax=Modestobacter roseus TaxID=1181884 RepID=A0A562ILY8_9ACTN|nr:ABC transporter permease subunit [Modestobacter roseus]MQA32240.1 ABC transporter permease subunit [Modestobacter roseus]TWH71735.1 ABC-type transport system involved in multi-copper enzyme maturation permease subunit [Modestobacter roseus]